MGMSSRKSYSKVSRDALRSIRGRRTIFLASPMQRTKSTHAFAKACQLIPGGVNSPARAFGGVGGQPIFIARGEGAYLIDVDGNRYLDYCGSWGPLILGHAHPRVVQAVTETMARGATFGAPTELETQLAELI